MADTPSKTPLPGAPRPSTNFWSFVGAYTIARREGDGKHQKAMRNFRWTFLSGFATVFCWIMFKWVSGYVDRVQASAEARDAAFVTAMAGLTEKTEEIGTNMNMFATKLTEMRGLAIGSGKIRDCPACICPKLPAIPACPPGSSVVVTFPSESQRTEPSKTQSPRERRER